MKRTLLLAAITICVSRTLTAQCDFEVNISPQNVLLCPNEVSQLIISGGNYDAVQWYHAFSMTGQGMEPIFGATSTSFSINSGEHSGYYFWASATADDCTENSDTILVDSYVFSGMSVSHAGEGTFDPNTQVTNLACGDTAILELLLPYNTNIVWFRNDVAIPGENESILEVTESGAYTVTGSPEVCPDWTGFFGFSLLYEAEQIAPALITVSNDTLFASPATSYQWYFEGLALLTATDSFFVASGNGSYVLETISEDSCTSTSEPFVFASTSTGLISGNDFEVTPVPASEYIHWNRGTTATSEIRLIDASGRLISVLKDNSGIIDISALDNGVYFLTIVKDGTLKTVRFIKTKQ